MTRTPTHEFQDHFVPPESWEKDHYTTLAYVETRLVDDGEFVVQADPRMRTKRRMYRILREHGGSGGGHPMTPEQGSFLQGGVYAAGHDDWDCVCDMAAAGVFEVHPGGGVDANPDMNITPEAIAAARSIGVDLIGSGESREPGQIEPGDRLSLTDEGRRIVSALRAHKAAGGSSSNFRPFEKAAAA